MAPENALAGILESTRVRVRRWKAEMPRARLRESVLYRRPPADFRRGFLSAGPRVIAEIKFASPSQGRIYPAAGSPEEAARVAGEYLAAGAAAVSVLTEAEHFSGSPEFLSAVRRAHPDALVLMKDFFIDVYQLEQARALGADAVLLIAAALGRRLETLLRSAEALGLSALVEVHTEAEMASARRAGASLIGVNSRDLGTLHTDLGVARALAAVPRNLHTAKGRAATHSQPVLIAESGIRTRADIDGLAACGYRGFLVGTHLMRSGRPGAALRELLA